METDRENIVPGNLIIIWELNLMKRDHWKRTLTVTFWRLLKFLKLKENSTTVLWLLKLFNTEKRIFAFLRLLKFLILKKYTITVLKFLIPKKDSITSLRLLKVLIGRNVPWPQLWFSWWLLGGYCWICKCYYWLTLVTWWLMLVTGGYRSSLLVPTFSMNEKKHIILFRGS